MFETQGVFYKNIEFAYRAKQAKGSERGPRVDRFTIKKADIPWVFKGLENLSGIAVILSGQAYKYKDQVELALRVMEREDRNTTGTRSLGEVVDELQKLSASDLQVIAYVNEERLSSFELLISVLSPSNHIREEFACRVGHKIA
jgi:hypothetical protein